MVSHALRIGKDGATVALDIANAFCEIIVIFGVDVALIILYPFEDVVSLRLKRRVKSAYVIVPSRGVGAVYVDTASSLAVLLVQSVIVIV